MVKHKAYRVLLLILALAACGSLREPAEERAHRAKRAKGDITIGAVWSWSATEEMIGQGIEMAVEEVNASGGVLGRQLRLVQADDESSVNQGMLVSRQFADNLDMVAVLGHFKSYISIPASATYEYSGLLMLSPGSTSARLTRQGFEFVFRNIPTDEAIGRALADFAGQQNLRRVLIYYVKDAYGRGFANSFERRARDLGIQVVDRLSFEKASDRDFRTVLKNWKYLEFDAICLVARMPHAGIFTTQARELGIDVPILGSDAMDTREFPEMAGDAAEGTFVASLFHLDDPRPEVKRFVAAFEKRYGVKPPARTVPGYDAVKLLAHAMEKAGSTVPTQVAQALRATQDWSGVTGPHTFAENGDVVAKPVIIKVVRNGRFEFLTRQ